MVDAVLAGADAAIPGLLLAEVVKEITTTETATMGTAVEAGRSLLRETHRLIQMLLPSQPAGCATSMRHRLSKLLLRQRIVHYGGKA